MVKKYRAYIIIFYALSIAALIAAAFVDLDLDKWLNNPQNPFAIWFCNTGEMPSRLICPIAGTVLFITSKTKLQRLGGAFVTIAGSAYLGYHIASYFFLEENMVLFGVVYGLGFGITCLIISKYIKIPKRSVEALRTIAIISIIVMFIQIGIIEGSKYLWGRVRFRDLLAQGSFEDFTAWYHPNGINGNKSFPSGHTAGAGMSYLMMFLPFVSKKWDSRRALCFVVPLVYTSVVAFTRLVMGAHYLSDVTVGGMVSFTIIIIAIKFFKKKC